MPKEVYDYLDTSDPEETEIPIKDLDNEYLINRCLLGDFTEDDKWKSCQELAFRCNQKMENELNNEEREKVRQSIIEEIITENELSEQIIEIPYKDPNIKPKKFKLPIRKISLFDAGFDTDKYINNHKKSDFGFCNLALYGLEGGFQEEIAELPFQSRKHAKIIKNSEKLIFAEGAIAVKESYDKDIHDVLISKNKRDILFEKCEYIDLNPFISDKTKYQYCTEANLNDQQNFIIKKREIFDKGYNTDTWDKLRKLGLDMVWQATKDEYKEAILDEVAKNTGISPQLYQDYTNYSKEEKYYILSAYQKHSHNELVNMTNNLSPTIKYSETGRLDCYHHFFQYASHPTQAYTEQLKLEAAYEFGDITKEEYIKMLDELKDNTELMKMAMHEPHQEPEDIKKLYMKKTEYLPIRYRIWGSQAYLNKIFHETNYWHSLNDARRQGGNYHILNTIQNAIDGADYIGMEQRILLSESEIEELSNLPNIDIDDLLECLHPISKDLTIDGINDEELIYSVKENEWNHNYKAIMDIIDLAYDEIEDHYSAVGIDEIVDLDDINENVNYKFIIIANGYIIGFEDHWEDVEPMDYMNHFKKKYPSITKEQIYYIFQRGLDSPPPFDFSFHWDINYIIAVKFDDLKEEVLRYMKIYDLKTDSVIWQHLEKIAHEYEYELKFTKK